jgi:hypothetical protein
MMAAVLFLAAAGCTTSHGSATGETATPAARAHSAMPAPADPDLGTVMERFYQQVEGGHWRFADAMLSPRLRTQFGPDGLHARYDRLAGLDVTLRQTNSRSVRASLVATDRDDPSRTLHLEETATLKWDGEQWTIDAIVRRPLTGAH